MRALGYALPFLFLATVPAGFWLGGGWAFLTAGVLPIAICGFDGLLGFDADWAGDPDKGFYRLLPWLYIPAQLAVTLWAAVMVARPETSLVDIIGLTISVGLTSGIFGMLAAHEMVHSPKATERGLGLVHLATCGYMQFRIAHIHGHHVHGATPDDPASARRGETAYGFVVRSAVGQAREAWMFEAERLRRRSGAVFSLGNRMLVYLGVEILLLAAVAAFSPRALVFWIGQAVLAVIMLELFNYIAHYGLQRAALAKGGFERMGPQHSWNSSRRMNNWSLFNMGRHSDHHARPTRAYQALETLDQEPELPTGYGGAILLALIPPIWTRLMDSRAAAWSPGTKT
jgi:alkane 1-monooxygenase